MSSLDRPLISLKVGKEGSKAEPIDLGDRLIGLSYEDNEKKADKLTLVLDNQDFKFLDDDTFKKGNTVIASWGYAGNMQSTECIVHRISGSLTGELKVEAEHKGFLLHKNKKSRVFDNLTRSEVAEKIGKLNGLAAADMDIQDTKVRHAHISQAAMTDAEFLKRLANKEGFEFYVDRTGMHFHERRWNEPPIKKLRWFTDRTGEIAEGSFESESKKKHGRVKSEGRDPITKKSFAVDSKNTTVERTSLASVIEHVDFQTGQTSLQARIADDDLRPSTETSAPAAKATSDGAFKKHQQSTFKMRLTIIGDPKVHAKSVVELTGIGKRYSGLWYITKCNHELEQNQPYLTKLECIRDGHNGHKNTSKDTKTKGSVNSQTTQDTGIRQVEVVNEKTGESSLQWRTK